MPELAMSLLTVSLRQFECCDGMATSSMEEGVAMYCTLVAADAKRFLPRLLEGLSNLAEMRMALGLVDDALSASAEGLDHIWPHFQREPRLFADDTWNVIQRHLERIEVAGRPPTVELIRRMDAY